VKRRAGNPFGSPKYLVLTFMATGAIPLLERSVWSFMAIGTITVLEFEGTAQISVCQKKKKKS